MSEEALNALQQELSLLRAAFESHLSYRLEQRAADVRERDNAKAGIDKRLDGMNEFREALRDQSSRFVERREYEEALNGVNARIAPLRADLGTRVDAMTIQMTTMVPRFEFDEVHSNLSDRTETCRAHGEAALTTLNNAFSERLEQYRTARDNRSEADLAPIRATLAQHGKPNWALLASIASIGIAAIAGVWLIIGLKIDNSVSPLTLDQAQTKTLVVQTVERVRTIETEANLSTQADSTSRLDRTQLNERVRQLEGVVPPLSAVTSDVGNLKAQYQRVVERLLELRTQVGQQQAALVEIETQFCGSDNMRNQIHAYDVRFTALLWQKVFDTRLPTDNAFYAQIGKCHEAAVAGR